ncbi:hypothetical protein D3C74_384090 [compost metagenome]
MLRKRLCGQHFFACRFKDRIAQAVQGVQQQKDPEIIGKIKKNEHDPPDKGSIQDDFVERQFIGKRPAKPAEGYTRQRVDRKDETGEQERDVLLTGQKDG